MFLVMVVVVVVLIWMTVLLSLYLQIKLTDSVSSEAREEKRSGYQQGRSCRHVRQAQ